MKPRHVITKTSDVERRNLFDQNLGPLTKDVDFGAKR